MTRRTDLPPLGALVEGVVEVHDPRAERAIDPRAGLRRLTEGGIWAEGPVWLPAAQAVMYSDVRADRAITWTWPGGFEVSRQPNDHGNGNTLDREGRLVHCEHGTRRVARTERDGSRVNLVDAYRGKRLNSPNDVVVKSDGTIWFTDPPYGIIFPEEGHPAPQEQDACYVFRFDPASGELSVVTDALIHPNGLAFSPGEDLLYVSDTSAGSVEGGYRHILVFDVLDGRRLGAPRRFKEMEPGHPDGLRVDEHGDVWSSAGDGVHIIASDGTDLATIHVPETTANLVFGSPDGRHVFITASSSLYGIGTRARGAGVAAAVARGERVPGAEAPPAT